MENTNENHNDQYVGVKIVYATPITLEKFIESTGRNPYANNPNPAKNLNEGYAVTYEDGYVGYSPKEVFEKAYKKVDQLNINCVGVISSDYKERFKSEYYALKERIRRLEVMMINWDCNSLSFVPSCPRHIYNAQLDFMRGYLHVLEDRAKIEKINLNSISE